MSASSTPASTARHPLRRRARERGRDHGRRATTSVVAEDDRGRLSRARNRLRRDRPRDRARLRDLERPRARRRASRAAGAVLLAGLRYAIEQGFDVINMSLSTTKKPFAACAPRARRQRVLPAHRARRLGAQHAGRELPVALLVGDLGRQPRGARPAGVLLQPEPAGRVLRARRERRRRLARAGARSPSPGTASRRRT